MKVISASVQPMNSMVAILDPDGDDVPTDFATPLRIAATRNMILVGCRLEMDGPTEVILGPATTVDTGETELRFDALLDTPNKEVLVTAVDDTVLLETPVNTETTRVRIWTNADVKPSVVVIGLGDD